MINKLIIPSFEKLERILTLHQQDMINLYYIKAALSSKWIRIRAIDSEILEVKE